jgi:nucleotide-binding universal stress UspA family protein
MRCFMITLKRILIPTDFGEAADAALAYGRELARSFGATLEVLHVVEDVYTRLAVDGLVAGDPSLQHDLEEVSRKRVEALLSDEDRAVFGARPVVLVSNTTATTIVAYAHETRVDLIVMGTHGRGGVAHLLMGSVAERVVRTAPCPVLTVRHPEHEFVLPDALVAVAKA